MYTRASRSGPRAGASKVHSRALPADVLSAQAGDREALARVLKALEQPIYRLAVRMLGVPELAEDAAQEVFLLIITQLSTFRGESAVESWAYRMAMRHFIRQRRRNRRWKLETLADEDLGQTPNPIAPQTLAHAEQRLLEEETFVGCTQAMLQALAPTQRAVFVLGALCELEAKDAAYILGTSEVSFRKRLSRVRAQLDAFVADHCGVANAERRCRCAHQVNYNVDRGVLNPSRLRFAATQGNTSLEALAALREIHKVRSSLELFRAQPAFRAPAAFAAGVRRVLEDTQFLSPT